MTSSVKRALEMRYLRRHVTELKDYLLSDKLKNAQIFSSFASNSKSFMPSFNTRKPFPLPVSRS